MQKNNWKINLLRLTLPMVLSLVMLFGMDQTRLISKADSAATVIANSANVRSSADSNGSIVASVQNGNKITVIGQIIGSDGYTWYKIYVDGNNTGFIRSDLVSITDGSTPPALEGATPSTDGMTAVNPVGAKVTGGTGVRVRADASTDSGIVATVSNGLDVTVTGTKASGDGKVWYYSEFTQGGATLHGFIRSDFVTLSGELTEMTETDVIEDVPADTGEVTEEPAETVEEPTPSYKDYDTSLQGSTWYLLDNNNGVQYSIDQIFENITQNENLVKTLKTKNRNLKVGMVILIILLAAALAGCAFFFMRYKNLDDDRAFRDAEKNAPRRNPRSAGGARDRGASAGRPSGAARPARDREGAAPEGRPQGQRPAGQGQRPAGQGQGQRPQGQRPVGQGQRPAGQGQRPAGERRPEGARDGRPQGAKVQSTSRPGAPAGSRPQADARARAQQAAAQQQKEAAARSRARNFAEDDDDDEFDVGVFTWDNDDPK